MAAGNQLCKLMPACEPQFGARFARLEVARDNMGHAGSTGSITLDVYSKTWWEERVDGVNSIVAAMYSEPDGEGKKRMNLSVASSSDGNGSDWEPFRQPQPIEPEPNST
jgi:hypothetical protein